MDISMPVMNGLDATRLISAELPDVRVVMLTASDNDDDLFEAIRSGASGYLSKDLEADRFVALLDGVTRGEPALSAFGRPQDARRTSPVRTPQPVRARISPLPTASRRCWSSW